jgi:hypothetical protein
MSLTSLILLLCFTYLSYEAFVSLGNHPPVQDVSQHFLTV